MAETDKEAAVASQHVDGQSRDAGTALQLAHDVDNTVYSPWSPTMFRLYLILICPYLCGCLNGYDGSLMGGLNGMEAYRNFFNM